jgi:hypothetical protein
MREHAYYILWTLWRHKRADMRGRLGKGSQCWLRRTTPNYVSYKKVDQSTEQLTKVLNQIHFLTESCPQYSNPTTVLIKSTISSKPPAFSCSRPKLAGFPCSFKPAVKQIGFTGSFATLSNINVMSYWRWAAIPTLRLFVVES